MKAKEIAIILIALFLIITSGIVIFIKYNSNRQSKDFNQSASHITESPSNIDAPDVKYYFDNLETFNINLSDSYSQDAIIKGVIISAEDKVVCKKAPCPPDKYQALSDIHYPNFRLRIGNETKKDLIENRIYILKGILWKSVDRGKQSVSLGAFVAREILK